MLAEGELVAERDPRTVDEDLLDTFATKVGGQRGAEVWVP
jgi:hypothetical protein